MSRQKQEALKPPLLIPEVCETQEQVHTCKHFQACLHSCAQTHTRTLLFSKRVLMQLYFRRTNLSTHFHWHRNVSCGSSKWQPSVEPLIRISIFSSHTIIFLHTPSPVIPLLPTPYLAWKILMLICKLETVLRVATYVLAIWIWSRITCAQLIRTAPTVKRVLIWCATVMRDGGHAEKDGGRLFMSSWIVLMIDSFWEGSRVVSSLKKIKSV